jgi:hypothetical protein
LKTLGDNLFKLHTVVKDIERECSVKVCPVFELSSLVEKSFLNL